MAAFFSSFFFLLFFWGGGGGGGQRANAERTPKESVLEADWEKNPLPHRGLEPASVLRLVFSVGRSKSNNYIIPALTMVYW